MSSVKVTNNTKDAKGVLAQFRLVDVDLEVCGEMIAPGASKEVLAEDWALHGRSYERLVKLGALSVEDTQVSAPIFTPVELKVDTKAKPKPALVFTDEKKSE